MKRINLLPKPKQRELSFERVFYSVAIAAIIAVGILILVVVVQLGVYFYLNGKVKSVDAEIEQLKRQANKSESVSVKAQIKTANAQILDFTKLSEQTPQWASIITAFIKDIPQSVKITQFDAHTDKQVIEISGYSPTRDSVIDLYNNINTDKAHFKNIDYPLENVTQPTDVRFSFTFNVADGVLVKGVK